MSQMDKLKETVFVPCTIIIIIIIIIINKKITMFISHGVKILYNGSLLTKYIYVTLED